MTKRLVAIATEADSGKRLDAFLAERFAISRAAAERHISTGAVEITGGTADNSLAKGVVPALDKFLKGYLVGHGNSPF